MCNIGFSGIFPCYRCFTCFHFQHICATFVGKYYIFFLHSDGSKYATPQHSNVGCKYTTSNSLKRGVTRYGTFSFTTHCSLTFGKWQPCFQVLHFESVHCTNMPGASARLKQCFGLFSHGMPLKYIEYLPSTLRKVEWTNTSAYTLNVER